MKTEMIKNYSKYKNFDYDFILYTQDSLVWNDGYLGTLFFHIHNNPIKCHYSDSIYGSEYGELIDKVLHD
jgi:hypothetical protein